MNKREQISVYIKNPTRNYLICRIINMGDSIFPDLKFTGVSSYGFMTNGGRVDGTLTPDVKIDYASNKIELSYHKDGSPLYKSQIKVGNTPWYSNYMQPGFRQIQIKDCNELLPLVIFQIRKPESYKSTNVDTERTKRKVYICSNEILFTEKQPLFAVIYIRNKKIPLTQIPTKDYYSDILAGLTADTDLCIFICRQNYPAPTPYYDKGFKSWITPYPCNSVSFCDQRALFDELVSKLHRNIFDKAFACFINVLGDGKLLHLTEEKLLILDDIDAFFDRIENTIIHKPQFARFVFEVYRANPQEFISKSPTIKQETLKNIWNIILAEGKRRNWFK